MLLKSGNMRAGGHRRFRFGIPIENFGSEVTQLSKLQSAAKQFAHPADKSIFSDPICPDSVKSSAIVQT
jgi:hypothetical protein